MVLPHILLRLSTWDFPHGGLTYPVVYPRGPLQLIGQYLCSSHLGGDTLPLPCSYPVGRPA